MATSYEVYVQGKTAEEILAYSHTADSNLSPYLQVAAQIRSNQDLVRALKEASEDSSKIGRRIVSLTVALILAAILQAAANSWGHLVWWITHGFRF
jgi:hypothetical protein